MRDVQRLINQDRNHFAACMVALGDADAMVTGVTRNYSVALEDIRRVIDPKPGHRVIGLSLVLSRGRTVLVADTAITEMPTAEELAEIAIEAAGVARRMGYEPRVAMLAFSTFGHPQGERSARVIEAVKILDQRRVDFEYEGDMAADVALNPEAAAAYPFSRLTGPANVLIMPAFHSASISTKMLQELGGATVIGPMLVGLDRAGADRAARRQGQPARQYGGAGGVQCERVNSNRMGLYPQSRHQRIPSLQRNFFLRRALPFDFQTTRGLPCVFLRDAFYCRSDRASVGVYRQTGVSLHTGRDAPLL